MPNRIDRKKLKIEDTGQVLTREIKSMPMISTFLMTLRRAGHPSVRSITSPLGKPLATNKRGTKIDFMRTTRRLELF